MDHKPLWRELFISIVPGIVFSLLTCGIYNLYWNAQQFKAMNVLMGREEYKFWPWFFFSLLTCGLYHIYYEYKMGTDLKDYFTSKGLAVNDNLPIIGLLLACVGLTIVSDAIYQQELNKLMP